VVFVILELSPYKYLFSHSLTAVSSFSPQSLKAPELKDRLEESEKLIHDMTITWEEKLRKTEEVAQVGHTVVNIWLLNQMY